MTQSRYSICITDDATEMPRCFSISIQSEVAWREALRAFTEPAIWIAPEKSRSFSVSVVLPASGWETMAKVRRRFTSGLSSVMGRQVSPGRRGGSPAAMVRAGAEGVAAPAEMGASNARGRVGLRRLGTQLLDLSEGRRLARRPSAGGGVARAGTFHAVHASVYQDAPDRCMA